MAAHVEHEFKGKFALEEEHLRKLDQMIRQKCPPEGKYKIAVKRTDSAAYTTELVDELCAEDNGPSATISSVSYLVESDKLTIKLEFVKEKKANLELVGEDRGEVFLIAGDLRSYIDAEVMRWRAISRKGFVAYVIPVSMLIMLFVASGFTLFNQASAEDISAALASRDLHAKLDFLIAQRPETRVGSFSWVMLIPLIIMGVAILNLHERVINFLYPYDDFFIGKKKNLLQKKAALRQNIFWIVFVTTGISVLVTWAFQRNS
ncbi:hypothetical protein GGD72_001648 [Stenotrophomonas maltophilia]|uniref:hypothetical protein n=1 Tax=Stenotrophomonas maltophilia TaxID=40324 RepID=UPI0013DC6032|nr:hypothetical protein [Stenotrophomonas maltophilia]MBB5530870.1 hypothetical protein [Stenotrophomonas maltophilia]